MHTHRVRTVAIAGVAIALVLALPSLSSASPRSRPVGAGHAFTHAQATRVLDSVRTALTPKPAPRLARGEALPPTDVTLQLRDLRLARASLTRSEQVTADRYLARPSVSSACSAGLLGGSVQASTHFCLHYSTVGLDAATADQVATTLSTLEYVWSYEVGTLGFRPPPDDGDGLFDVYLKELGNQGIYGYCAPDNPTAHSSSYCVLDNDFSVDEFHAPPMNSLQVTAAHEFFHAVQFGYDTGEDVWFMEGSAVWAEDQVFPAINDYVQYLSYSAIARPSTPTDYTGTFERYGAVLFWKFLSERFNDPTIIRRVWEFADGTTSSRYSLQAVTGALAERGWSFEKAYAEFGVWNTRPPVSYGDQALYPPTAWWSLAGLGRSHRDTGRRSVVLNHLTNAALLLRPTSRLPRHTKVRIIVDAPALARMPRALVQVRRRSGLLTVYAVPLDGSGYGSRLVSFDPRHVASVVVTLTNASTRMTGCGTDSADAYSCAGQSMDDNQRFAVRARLRLP